MLMFSTTATILENGMLSVRVPPGVRHGLHEVTIIVRDVVGSPSGASTSSQIDPVDDAIGADPAAEAAAYQAVYRTAGR